MDESRTNILNGSNKLLSKLQLLSAYFGDELLYKIYLRSQVIHQLFANNAELDVNKLDLFHLQFTATLIELLKKIKKSNEKNLTLLFDEVELNKGLIDQIKSGLLTEAAFNNDKQRQALKVNTSLRNLYRVLSDGSAENPFAKNINNFSARYAEDFFYDVPDAIAEQLMQYNPGDVYTNGYAIIQRKLLGVLCKYDFMTSFYCGLKTGGAVIEVYKFNSVDRYFLYYPSRNLFLFCDIAQLAGLKKTDNQSKKQSIVQELEDKNNQLLCNITTIKTYLPAKVRDLLAENYKKISDINFLQNISSFDVQANILKTMLNTDIF